MKYKHSNSNLADSLVREGRKEQSRGSITPTKFGKLNSADKVSSGGRLDKPRTMAGDRYPAMTAYIMDPSGTDTWLHLFNLSNQGKKFNEGKTLA
tara:strand:- start:236 stop:520 length:285 start_codon:yes stop_codon:yes gene_type:complete